MDSQGHENVFEIDRLKPYTNSILWIIYYTLGKILKNDEKEHGEKLSTFNNSKREILASMKK